MIWYLLYVAYAFIGFGLWKLRAWARRAVLGILIFGLVVGLIGTLVFTRPASMALAMLTWVAFFLGWQIWYLMRPRVRYVFSHPDAEGQFAAEVPPRMSRSQRALTWVVALGTFGLCLCTMDVAIGDEICQSDIYKVAVAEAGRSPCVASRLGGSLTLRRFAAGGMEVSETEGSAEIPLRGSKGKGTLSVSAQRVGGSWQIRELFLTQGDARITLLPASATSACQ